MRPNHAALSASPKSEGLNLRTGHRVFVIGPRLAASTVASDTSDGHGASYSTLLVWMALSFLYGVTGEMVCTVYCRVHPLAVSTSFSLSVCARGLAYGVTRPLRPSRDVAATTHITSSG